MKIHVEITSISNLGEEGFEIVSRVYPEKITESAYVEFLKPDLKKEGAFDDPRPAICQLHLGSALLEQQ